MELCHFKDLFYWDYWISLWIYGPYVLSYMAHPSQPPWAWIRYVSDFGQALVR